MALATVFSRASVGMNAPQVVVEVHLGNGLPAFTLVGLPEKAVQESRERVRAALLTAGFEFPARRITVNLAPADLPKDGGRFDLAIAIGILAASGQIHTSLLPQAEFLGELTLSGQVRPINGILPAALATRNSRRALFLPMDNLAEASLINGVDLLPVSHLLALVEHLNQQTPIIPQRQAPKSDVHSTSLDLADVHGQQQAKRALALAAAGGHHLLFSGPPGSGKSMLASRLPGILPPMNEEEALEHAIIRSISGQGFDPGDWKRRPFRSPHHTASATALVGGGRMPRPGEISLAHLGVLFLDEIAEFPRTVLDVLREPLESGEIHISRARQQVCFPARFQLVAAMNPCPCGYLGDPRHHCRCTSEQILRYRSRISGPLLDRIDLQVEVPAQPAEHFVAPKRRAPQEKSVQIAQKVLAARQIQLQRQNKCNAFLNVAETEQYCHLGQSERNFLIQAIEKLGLSARAYHRILRVARTIADFSNETAIGITHLSEAIGYRRFI